MASPNEPGDLRRRSPLRLISGLDVLEEWSQNATQPAMNLVNQVLFSVADRRVFSDYTTVDDPARTMEFFVLTKQEIAVKIRVHDLDTFGIVYVGPTVSAPGLDGPAPEPGSSAREARQDDPAGRRRKRQETPRQR
jgi:Family of unknown function (DUF6235)